MACELLVAACMGDLVPRSGIEPRPPALGVQSLTPWTTREVTQIWLFIRLTGGVFFRENLNFISGISPSALLFFFFFPQAPLVSLMRIQG